MDNLAHSEPSGKKTGCSIEVERNRNIRVILVFASFNHTNHTNHSSDNGVERCPEPIDMMSIRDKLAVFISGVPIQK
jgi:hypothetical protein